MKAIPILAIVCAMIGVVGDESYAQNQDAWASIKKSIEANEHQKKALSDINIEFRKISSAIGLDEKLYVILQNDLRTSEDVRIRRYVVAVIGWALKHQPNSEVNYRKLVEKVEGDLIFALTDSDLEVRQLAATTIYTNNISRGSLGLTVLMRSDDESDRLVAIKGIIRMEGKSALPVYWHALFDQSEDVALYAVEGISQCEWQDAEFTFRRYINSPHAKKNEKVFSAIMEILSARSKSRGSQPSSRE